MASMVKKIKSFLKRKEEEGSSVKGVPILLRCGEREIVGDEYNTLALYNSRIQSTEFGSLLFCQLMDKYGQYEHVYGREDGIKYAYDFGTENNLASFVKECRRYLKLD